MFKDVQSIRLLQREKNTLFTIDKFSTIILFSVQFSNQKYISTHLLSTISKYLIKCENYVKFEQFKV